MSMASQPDPPDAHAGNRHAIVSSCPGSGPVEPAIRLNWSFAMTFPSSRPQPQPL